MGINDLIKLSNNREYIITNIIEYKGIKYYLLVDIDDPKKYKIVYQSGKAELSELTDNNLLARVTLLMSKDLLI